MDKKSEIVNNNLGLVHSLAKKFKGRGIEYDDLFQAGCVGLLKAIDGFDDTRGAKLSTYAVPVILGEIKRLFRDGGTIKVGRSLKELSLKIKRFIDEYSQKSGTEPSVKEIAEHFCIEPEQVAQALEASMLPMSLTQEGEDGENQLDIPVESHDERLSEVIALNQTVSTLNEKDKNIIFLRFYKNMTQNETAKKLGMTQVQVSRREKIILRELRVKLS